VPYFLRIEEEKLEIGRKIGEMHEGEGWACVRKREE
jgi:hypothetical protein